MLLDVDDFKLVNDTLGHSAGDAVLVEVATRLRLVLREGETVARLGGDEFALVAEGFDPGHGTTSLLERIRSIFAEPFAVGRTKRHMTGSLGIVIAGQHASPDRLLRDADTAMYRAKSTGKGGIEFFDSALRTQLLRQVAIGRALEGSIHDRRLEFRYQPIVSLADRRVLAVEAPGALAGSALAAGRSPGVHRPRREERADRAARPLRTGRGRPPDRGVAPRVPRRPAARRLRQHVAARARGARASPGSWTKPCRRTDSRPRTSCSS